MVGWSRLFCDCTPYLPSSAWWLQDSGRLCGERAVCFRRPVRHPLCCSYVSHLARPVPCFPSGCPHQAGEEAWLERVGPAPKRPEAQKGYLAHLWSHCSGLGLYDLALRWLRVVPDFPLVSSTGGIL